MCAGELLVKKAREGVRVCMLVWDDKSSLNSKMMGGSGMMATHDEDTRRYFANTGVSTLVFLLRRLQVGQVIHFVSALGPGVCDKQPWNSRYFAHHRGQGPCAPVKSEDVNSSTHSPYV